MGSTIVWTRDKNCLTRKGKSIATLSGTLSGSFGLRSKAGLGLGILGTTDFSFVCFSGTGLLCSSDPPVTNYVDQASLDLIDIYLPLPPEGCVVYYHRLA